MTTTTHADRKWRKAALDQLPALFVDCRARKAAGPEAGNNGVHEEIGRLKVELDSLKRVGMLN